ncbi:hypothetical protein B0O80DRAFT_529667 [Mortierella sp. GBAus27b]|nr:hypothetical protein B0O80DRAFT_529667 [Mortierella sp. GBAus27b]
MTTKVQGGRDGRISVVFAILSSSISFLQPLYSHTYTFIPDHHQLHLSIPCSCHPSPTMEATQSFRLVGTTDILKIPCDQDDGHNVIYWHDIIDAFPGTQYVKHGSILIKRLRDIGTDRNKPQRIKHYPGVILDVVVSSPSASDPTTSSTTHSKTSAICHRTAEPPVDPVDDNTIEDLDITASNVDKQVVKIEHNNSLGSVESTFEQRLVAFLPPDIQTQVLGSSDVHEWMVQAIRGGQADRLHEQLIACLQHLKDEMSKNNELVSDVKELASRNNEMACDIKDLALRNNEMASKNNELVTDVKDLTIKNTELSTSIIKMQEAFDAKQEEVKQLQIQALSQLALLQNRVSALVTQTFELHEYPIPRLFVVLPQDTSSWNPINLFSNKFRLYFLCECGEHTKSTNTKIPHHIHIAKHEGYEISQPNEFFEQYGHYVLTILKMLRFGISVAGVAIPAVSHLVRTDALAQASEKLKDLSRDLQKGLDQAIGCLEKVTADDTKGSDGIFEQMENNEALEGADLRKLETFLKNEDGNKVLGNLYRTITSEGHVKWVCIDHYRENYHEKAVKAFRDTVESIGGSFDENIGRVAVHLRSKTQADQFYQALEKSKSVHELNIVLDWETTQSDFKKLRDTLRITNVGALRLDLKHQTGPTSGILNRNRRHDPILDIMRHPSTRSIAIIGPPEDFIERSSLPSRNNDISNMRHFVIDLSALRKDVPGIKALLSRMSNLSLLELEGAEDLGDEIAEVYNAIVDHQTYPIAIDYQFCLVRISPPTRESRLLPVTARNVKELFHGIRDRIEIMEPDRSALVKPVADVFRKSKWDGGSPVELVVTYPGQFGDRAIKNLSTVVSWSELRSLVINLRGEEGRAQILESIQWKHIRSLSIHMNKERLMTRMRALIEGRDKVHGPVELDDFLLDCLSIETESSECAALFKSFVASTSLKGLYLFVLMTPSDMESVLNSMDVSRLEEILLRAKGYSSPQVDCVLDCLTNAHNLQNVILDWYTPTQEQKKRMQERGVTLVTLQ